MAKERLKSPRVRLFVALDLPAEVRDRIVAWGNDALSDRALRPVSPEALHITLAFLGWRWEREVPRAAEIVHRVGAAAPRIELAEEPVGVPPRRAPRLFALDAPSEDTVALQRDIEAKLVAAGLYKPEKRPFWSHLTVARVRKVRGEKRYMRVERAPPAIPEALRAPFFGVRVTLYRSVLLPAGAEYTPLAQVELPTDEAAVR